VRKESTHLWICLQEIIRIEEKIMEMNLQELKTACMVANARTEERQKAREKHKEKVQIVAFLLMLGLTTLYWG